MKKQEILNVLNENNLTSNNVKTFINKNKKLNYDKCYNWLLQQEEKEEKQRIADEIKANAKKFNISVKEYNELQKKAIRILNDFDTQHSMGYTAHLRINSNVFATVDNTDEYSRSCKYQAQHGHYVIELKKSELRNIKFNEHADWKLPNGKMLQVNGSKGAYSVELR